MASSNLGVRGRLFKVMLKGSVSYILVPVATFIMFAIFLGVLYLVVTLFSSKIFPYILLAVAIAVGYLLAAFGLVCAYKKCRLIKSSAVGWGIVFIAFVSSLVFIATPPKIGFGKMGMYPAPSMTSQQWAEEALKTAVCEKPPCKHRSIESIVGPMRTEKEWRYLAEGGDKTAQSEQCSEHGFKKDVDTSYYSKIVAWCRSDADEGSLQSEYLLGQLYAKGQGGLSQSWEEAYFWYAVRIMDGISPVERDEVAQHLTPQQVGLLNERVANWKQRLCASKPASHDAIVERESHCKETPKKE